MTDRRKPRAYHGGDFRGVMRIITFTADDRNALAHDRYHHPTPRPCKMEVLWLKSHGLTHDQLAADADVSRRTASATSTSIMRAACRTWLLPVASPPSAWPSTRTRWRSTF